MKQQSRQVCSIHDFLVKYCKNQMPRQRRRPLRFSASALNLTSASILCTGKSTEGSNCLGVSTPGSQASPMPTMTPPQTLNWQTWKGNWIDQPILTHNQINTSGIKLSCMMVLCHAPTGTICYGICKRCAFEPKLHNRSGWFFCRATPSVNVVCRCSQPTLPNLLTALPPPPKSTGFLKIKKSIKKKKKTRPINCTIDAYYVLHIVALHCIIQTSAAYVETFRLSCSKFPR